MDNARPCGKRPDQAVACYAHRREHRPAPETAGFPAPTSARSVRDNRWNRTFSGSRTNGGRSTGQPTTRARSSRPWSAGAPATDRRAVLYLHGFVDYFFQTHLADFFTGAGYDFYALDLRKYGRSLLPAPDAELRRDLSRVLPRARRGGPDHPRARTATTVLVNGHSTGGLIAALWAARAARRRARRRTVPQQPVLRLQRALAAAPTVGCRRSSRLGRRRRRTGTSRGELGTSTARACTRPPRRVGLRPDLEAARRFPGPRRLAAAIRRGQRRLRAGLAIDVPVLVACSTRTFQRHRGARPRHSADAVLDVEHIVRWAPRLGRHVTLVRFDGGMHDLTLSGAEVRSRSSPSWPLDRRLPAGPDRPRPRTARRSRSPELKRGRDLPVDAVGWPGRWTSGGRHSPAVRGKT